jgi:sulfite exporter TauE/SafE
MPLDLLTLGAAFLSGLVGSVHCIAMCGGIATGLSAASAATGGARPALDSALALNLGRIAGYTLAGLLVGAFGGGLVRVADAHAWQVAWRVALGIALMLIALRVAGAGDHWNLLGRLGAPLWRALAPLQRRLIPARTWPRRLALGLLWGWLPCGLSSSLLFVAWLQADALHGALVMLAFGAGTLPAMVPLTWSGARGTAAIADRHRMIALAIFFAGLLTAAAPWLMQVPALHAVLAALGCRPSA